MLYENYRKKIIKVADILKTVRKFRVLIITFLIALLCVMAVLLGIQGVVYDVTAPLASVVYGQPFEYEAGAVMGSVRYEYAKDGSDEWTAEQPIRAGAYKVRAVAKDAFGGDRYGAEHSFTIEPKPIDVTLADSSAVYGEEPLLAADLAYSDVIRCVAFSYDYAQTETDVSEGMEIRVFDENGEDVTSSYSFRSVEGTLLIEQRTVTITTDSAEKVYDGTPLTDPGYTVSDDTPLAEGDGAYIDKEAELTAQATITAAGSVENSLAFFFKKSVTVGGEEVLVDVTHNYEAEILYGTLTVKRRPVTFVTASRSWVYDGAAHSSGGHSIAAGEGEYGLLEGHMMAVDEGTFPQATEAGEVQNKFAIRIESAGEDVTENYDVAYEYGTLTITPRPVTFVAEGHEWVYDGTAHSWGGHSVAESGAGEYGLLEGHTSKAVGFTYVTNVAESGTANALTVAVYDGEREVTGNYAISYDEENAGELTITPRPVTFVTEGHEWIYDGTAHSWGGHSVAESAEEEYGLADGHASAAVGFTCVTNVAESGTANALTIAVYDGAEDVTANYHISYENAGLLTVTPRPIVVTAASGEKVYDGMPFSYGDFADGVYYLVASGAEPALDPPVAAGQTLEVETQLPASADVYENGAHTIVSVTVWAGDTEVTQNYSVQTADGLVSVTPRAVTFVTESRSWVYDGAAHSWGGHAISENTAYPLVSGHKTEVVSVTEITNVWESPAENVLELRIVDADGKDVSHNYEIGYEYGTLTITPRSVVIVTATDEKVYDGTPLVNGTSVASENGAYLLVEGHYTVWNGEGTLPSVTDVLYDEAQDVIGLENVFVVHILGADENDVTENYAIEYEYGTLTITPRPVTFVSEGHEWVYDGTAHSWGGHSVAESTEEEYGLVEGHTSKAVGFTYVTNVAESGTVNKLTLAVYDGEREVTGNYAISYDEENAGELSITPRPVTFATESRSWVYDGTAHSWGGHTVASDSAYGLADGHTSKATDFTYITDVQRGEGGEVVGIPNVLVIEVYGADGMPVDAANYSIAYEYGTLKITPRPIVVTAASGEKVYDGTPFGYDDFADGVYYLVASGAEPALDPPVAAGQELRVETQLPESADVYENGAYTIVSVTVWAGDTEVTQNYSVQTADGVIVIAPRPITVTAGSSEKVYDGTPLTCGTYSITSEIKLVEGHTLTANTVGSRTEVGRSPNKIEEDSIVILSADGRDVLKNYAVTCEDGVLIVTPRAITIVTGSRSWVYDGNAHSWYEDAEGNPTYFLAEGSTLAEGQAMRLEGFTEITNAGSVANVLTIGIYDGEGISRTANYTIDYIEGTLTVTPRALTVVTESKSWVYDGTAHSWSGHSVFEDSAYPLVSGHKTEVASVTEITNVWESPAQNVLALRVVDADGNNVTQNYAIEYEYGTLEITPRPIVVTAASGQKVYDGTPFGYDDFADGEYYFVASGAEPALDPPVAPGQTLEVETQLPASADVYENGAHTISSVAVRADGTDVTQNYSIQTEDGLVSITPRPIVVTAASGQKVYDGMPFTYDDFADGEYYLVASGADPALEPPVAAGQTLSVESSFPSAADAGRYAHTIVSVTVWAGDTEVTQNYSIRTADGAIVITPRPITVTAGSAVKVYNGTPLTCDEAAVSSALSPALVLDHEIRFAVSGSQTEIGESENTLTYAAVFAADGTDVSRNYQITEENGTLTVLIPGTLIVHTEGAEKIFDGTELVNAEYSLENTLGEGYGMHFTVVVTCTGSQLHAGESENTAEVRVTNEAGEDVTKYAQIGYDFGLLIVAPRPVKVVTGSQTWEYDGQPHSYPDETRIEAVEYDGVSYGLVQGHEAAFSDHAEISMPGTMPNSVTVTVTDGGTIDFTDDYDFEYELGTLEIIGGSGGGGGASDLDTSGQLGGGELGGEGAAFRVYADASANIYMRLLSFGNYNGGGWVYAPEYGQLLDGTYGMNYLTGAALAEAGYTSLQIAVEMYTNDYLLPDYMAMGAGNYTVQTSDVWYKGDASQVYSLPYYVYEYLENGAPKAGLGVYAAAEEAYRAFVYANYLTVRESARACMEAIIAEQGFRADDPEIVAKVAAYIQNAATYNLQYDKAMDNEADIVVAFLTKYKEGICQHYASAATLLFRMLGIPARYTIGYAGATSAGEWVETGVAHAWTEVYIDGVGWVHVEVTGGGPGGGGGGGSEEPAEELTIKPVDKTKQFDGKPLTADAVQGADEKSALRLNELLAEGYTYRAEFAGSITEPGTTESTIEHFVLYDPQGAEAENITFTFEPGTLTVVSNVLITMHPYVLQKYYDGTPLSYNADDYWVSGLPSGWRIEGFSLEGIGRTEVGAITADADVFKERLANVKIYDESGLLLAESEDYTLVIDGSTLLSVDRRAITVSSYSDTKQYDGTPLTNDHCWISSGSLANGHILEATVTGSITDVGAKDNTIGSVVIRDEEGNGVTENYKVSYSFGKLIVLDG